MNRKFHPLLLSTTDVGEPFAWKGKKPKTPKAPDYAALAKQQAQQQLMLNRETTQANRVNQFTPYGSLTYTQDANDPDKWTSNVELDPEIQKVLDQYVSGQQQGYGLFQDYLKNINDPSKVNAAPINPGQTAQDAIMARINPAFQTREEDLRTRLMNQGVRPGSEAWDNEFRNFSQARNDAYSQAALQGINLDTQARQNALQEQSLPLNALAAYLGGTQIQNPQFINPAQQSNTQSADLMGAAQAGYGANLNAANAQNAANNNFMSGLFGLGGSILGGPLGGAAGSFLGGLF